MWTSNLRTICVGLVVLGLICGATATAQVAGGNISGTVTDSASRVVGGVQITITNVATGVTRVVTTNDEGVYSAPNLQPGTYEIEFSAKGFKVEKRNGVEVTVGAAVVLDFSMKVGELHESVVVQSEVPAVQLSTSDISAVVNATTVRELPLNGRSWTDLAQLQAGVSAIHTQPDFAAGTDRGNRGFGQQLTISGARPQQNNYRLDGVSLNDYANGAPGSVLGGSLGVDAIQEFSVITSNYSAEYGKTSGGVVNAITRSGTNQIHGSGYEFIRNSKLDAANYFEAGQRSPFKRNQFGGTLGGPIVKDHTFFFADAEFIRQSKGIPQVVTVPSDAARNGTLFSYVTCAGTISPVDNSCQDPVDPSAAKYLTFWPHAPADAQVAGSDTALYTFSGQQVVNENFITTRIDHHFSDKDSLSGSYMFDRTPYSSPDGMNNVEFQTLTARQFVSIEETHIFSPSFANSIRIGGNHEVVNNNQSVKALNPDASRTDLGAGGTAFAGRAASQVVINSLGITPFSGGVGGSPTYYYHWNSLQLYDDAFLTKGKHSLKFGGAFERMMLNVIADTDPNGIWIFDDLPSFLTNVPHKFQGGIANTLSPRNLRQNIFGAYVQDDWRLKPNLTVNLGLRYEMSTVLSETAGKTANLANIGDALPICGKVVTGCASSGAFFANPTLKNLEPRIGFAWDVFGKGKTAVRGGIGLFDVLPLPYQFVLMTTQSAPFFSYTAINANDPTLPVPLSFYKVDPSDISPNSLRSTYVDSRKKRNYITQWNLNVQQQLTPTLAGMVAYVGSRGVHQPFKVDEADLVIPTKTPYGYLWPQVDVNGNLLSGPNAGNPPDPINKHFGSVRGIFYEGHSYYNALEAQLAKRMSHGFQVQGTFTWGKSMDTSSASVAGDTFGNSISSLHWFDMSLSRGLSDFNVGRTLVVNGTWEAPTPKSFSAPAQWALGGWELGIIFSATDGEPFTATWATGSDPQGTLSSDDWAFPNRLGGSGCKTVTQPGNPNQYVKVNPLCFQVPTAPNLQWWTANCDAAPPSLGYAFDPVNPANPVNGNSAPWLPPLACFNLRGNSGRNTLIGPGVTSLDFSVYKNNYIKRISENFNIQFRAEFFNIINHANFAPPASATNTDVFDGTGQLNPALGALTKTTTSAREIQFAIKVIF